MLYWTQVNRALGLGAGSGGQSCCHMITPVLGHLQCGAEPGMYLNQAASAIPGPLLQHKDSVGVVVHSKA